MPTSPAQPDVQPGTPLVLVSGSGRSGTSSLAGTLKRLGLHVPQPEVEASETNPRGFYEPQWVIDFHKRHLKELALFNIDSRPAAVDLVAHYVESGKPTAELHEWLSTQLGSGQIVVKDPHAFWFAQVWEQVTAELDVDLRWLTALRHPAEVVGSRDIAYLSSQSDDLRLTKETSNVAGWVHAALLTERAGRGGKRAFVRYVDLLADWRAALAPVQQQLDLAFNTDLASSEHHDVDDFIEPSMRKSTAHLGRRAYAGLAARHGRGGLAPARRPHHLAARRRRRRRAWTRSTRTTPRATPTRSRSPSTTPAPSRCSPVARRATPSGPRSSSCAATSTRRGARHGQRRGARRRRSRGRGDPAPRRRTPRHPR